MPSSMIYKMLFAALALLTISEHASSSDYYAGKTLTIISSGETGGGYDIYARLLGRYISHYLPGSPPVIVQDVVGAGGVRAAQQLYALAPKDGTVIGNVRASGLLDSILGLRASEVIPSNFNWIGSMSSDTDLCSFWHTSGIVTFADLKKKEVIVGASGKGAQNYSFPNAMNRVLGTKMKIVLGYAGMNDRILAMERGELQGNCGINSSTIASVRMQEIDDGNLVPVVQSGLRPYSAFPKVPLTQNFATSERDKDLLSALFSQMDIARLFGAPPGIAQDRLDLLRRAFDESLADPALVAEAEKLKIDLNPVDGKQSERIVRDMSNISDDLKKELRTIIGE